VSGDDLWALYLNGVLIAGGDDASVAQIANAPLLPGRNVLAARVVNRSGPEGLLVDLPTAGGRVISNGEWKVSSSVPVDFMDPSFNDRGWTLATSYGRLHDLSWRPHIDGFPADSTAEWIAGPDVRATTPLAFRLSFTSGDLVDRAEPTANGFASLPGRGLATTTGGGRPPSATVTTATTAANLLALVSDDVPRIIHVPEGVLDFHTAPRLVAACLVPCGPGDPGRSIVQVPVAGRICTELDPAATITTVTRDEGRFSIGSNKTIVGDGAGATLSGANIGFRGSSNIILRNLIFQDVNPTLLEASDALTIENAHHIWIDHCTFKRFSDDAIDVILPSQSSGGTDEVSSYLTFSWNHFDGGNPANCSGRHPGLSNLKGALITAHHNWYEQSLNVAPTLRGALLRFHGFNNAFSHVQGVAVNLAGGGQALMESNWFDDVGTPFSKDGASLLSAPGPGDPFRGNVSTRPTQALEPSADAVFSDLAAFYPYTLDPPSSVSSVPGMAGAGVQVR